MYWSGCLESEDKLHNKVFLRELFGTRTSGNPFLKVSKSPMGWNTHPSMSTAGQVTCPHTLEYLQNIHCMLWGEGANICGTVHSSKNISAVTRDVCLYLILKLLPCFWCKNDLTLPESSKELWQEVCWHIIHQVGLEVIVKQEGEKYGFIIHDNSGVWSEGRDIGRWDWWRFHRLWELSWNDGEGGGGNPGV